MVSIIVIRLNKRLFSQVDDLLTMSEQEAQEKEVQHQTLKENVDIMISQITNVNDSVQRSMQAQDELANVITEMAAGSTSQSDQIFEIAEHAQSRSEQMKQMFHAFNELSVGF